MKIGISIILFLSFTNFSFCQENGFNEIKYNQKLQVEQRDTLQNIGKRLTGKWKYLGKNDNGILTDTISIGFRNDEKMITTIENGIVFETVGRKKNKADYFYEITCGFKNKKMYYYRERKYYNDNIISITDCQPIPELVYYNTKFGIVYRGMGGDSFIGINELTSEKLIFENGKEFSKLNKYVC